MSDHDDQNIEASVLAEIKRARAEREKRGRDTRDKMRDRGPAKESGEAEATCRDGGTAS